MLRALFRGSFVVAIFVLALVARGEEAYLSIAGSTGVFRTDARIFNPSFTSDIVINASFLPAGNVSNLGVTPKPITIGKRAMVAYDDVVTSLFGASGLGAIRLVSEGDFVATQRIYATTTEGTLGQFVPGLDISAAKTKNVIVQLKSTGSEGEKGTFRTNVGLLNPNTTAANVTLVLYDKTNTVVGNAVALKVEPLGVVAPTNIAAYFNSQSGDLSDAWLSVRADVAVFAYGSVVDNGTTDPTFVASSEDTGEAPTNGPGAKEVLVGPDFRFEPESLSIFEGDTVKWTFRAPHTTTSDTGSAEQWDSGTKGTGDSFSYTFEFAGTFPYHCSLHSASGGSSMNGTIIVAPRGDPNPYPYKQSPKGRD